MEAVSLVFIITSTVLIITPGQDMILVMSRSISQGRRAGIVTALGVSVGLLGHTILATFGLGALLLASKSLFTFVKIIGALYLFYLGINLLRSDHSKLSMDRLPEISYKKMFFQGILSNITNPKIAIFFFSYLPQFVVMDGTKTALQLFILGVTFAIVTFCIKAPIGYISGSLSSWIKAKPNFLSRLYKGSGIIFLGLGIKLAFEKRG
ncbi:MAG: LysE family translocator [Epsilonproteobacteria bacterium]|nr:LysE family translocator [Campylobacterota bacterium]